MGVDKKIKLIAMYFPQLHAIPENDGWWGAGFTDWVNVRKARPQFEGHNQPRIPLDNHYYDQSQMETLRWQVDLAKSHGVYGFCHYHYWFDGKQLLETPTNLMLQNKELDLPFCLSWANETWSRRWDASDYHVLIKQTHPAEKSRWKLHFDYLLKAWSDDRAIKVDGKPVFVIYRPQHISHIDDMLDYWRELAVGAGLNGLYFLVQKNWEFPRRDYLKGFDAIFQFQPFEAMYSPFFENSPIKHRQLAKLFHLLPESVQSLGRAVYAKLNQRLEHWDYDEVWNQMIQIHNDPELTTYPGVFVDWDNTARYGNRARVFKDASPERFEPWFARLVDSMEKRNLPENFMFLNAWNEWAEGAYLEPDEKNGYGYLQAIERQLVQKQTGTEPIIER